MNMKALLLLYRDCLSYNSEDMIVFLGMGISKVTYSVIHNKTNGKPKFFLQMLTFVSPKKLKRYCYFRDYLTVCYQKRLCSSSLSCKLFRSY